MSERHSKLSGSASQPAMHLQAGASQPSASTPAAAEVVEEILKLGFFPSQRRNPSNEDERKEQLLAKQYQNQKKYMSSADLQKLMQLKVDTKPGFSVSSSSR